MLDKPKQPTVRRFETNDITTPKLIQFLSENPNVMMLFRDELTGWLKSLEADYEKSARSCILELWKGAVAYELSRVDGREIRVTSGTLSIIGGIQPSMLQRYVTEAYSVDNSDGFLQRFLFAYPDIDKRPEKPTESDYHAMQKGFAVAKESFGKLAEYDFNGRVVGANGGCFHIVKFAPDAQKEVDEWKDETDAEAEKLQIEDEAFSSFLYKLPKSCFAITLIFHCLENNQSLSLP
jgi:putative DNA primase/helicase